MIRHNMHFQKTDSQKDFSFDWSKYLLQKFKIITRKYSTGINSILIKRHSAVFISWIQYYINPLTPKFFIINIGDIT